MNINIRKALITYQKKQLVELNLALAEKEKSYKNFTVDDMRERLNSGQLLGLGMQIRLFLYRQQLGVGNNVEGAKSTGAYKG